MKYLKISFLLLIFALIINCSVTLAYSTNPISGTVDVKSYVWKNTPERTKTNYKIQRFMIIEATCSGCTFQAKAVTTSGASTNSVKNIGFHTTVNLSSDASFPGDWHVSISRDNFSLISRNVGYTYDPNALVY